MKTRFILPLFALALSHHLLQAQQPAPRFQHPLLQLVQKATAITETDLAVYTRAFADGTSVEIAANSTFLKGGSYNAIFEKTQEVKTLLQEISRSSSFNPLGAKVFQFHLSQNKATALVGNDIILVSGDLVESYRERLRELIPLVEKQRKAQLWKWVIAGMTHPNPMVKSDARQSIYYVTDGENYLFDHYENRKIRYINQAKSLDINDFPSGSKEALATIANQQVFSELLFHIPNHSLISLCYELQVPGFSESCLRTAEELLTRAEYAVHEPTENLIYIAHSTSALVLARMALSHPASSQEQRQRAARLLVFAQRWQIANDCLTRYPLMHHPEHNHYLPALADFAGGNDLRADVGRLVAQFQAVYRKEAGKTNELLQEALAFNTLAASRVNMCADPVIEKLTGNRNWWNCHQVETPDVQVLANAQTSHTSEKLAIVVAPNPVPREGRITVGWQAESEATEVVLRLTDVSGRIVWEKKHLLTRYTDMQQADVQLTAGLSAGLYTLAVQYPDRRLDVKVWVE